MTTKRFVLSLALLLPALAGANEEIQQLTGDPNNWATWGGNYAGTRYSTLSQIDKSNVGNLKVAWTFSTGVLRGHEGGPLVVGGTLYIHTPFPNKVFSINLADQTINWTYAPVQNADTIPVMCCDTVNRGLAYGDGKIFLQQADTTLVALDAKTGQVAWSVKNGDPAKGETNTNAPLIVKDKVITGISGGEYGVRGFVVAYDIKTGRQVWKAYSVGPDNELLVDPRRTTHLGKPIGANSSLSTWEGEQWRLGGGTTWGWFTYDPALNLIYYGSGNPGTWNPVVRPGDNRWSMTLFARDADTGMAKWVYQMTPHDEWDYDGVNENVLVDLEVDGRMRKTLVHFDRNGFGYTLDRENGELLVAEKFDPAVNWATHVDMRTGRPQVVDRYSTQQERRGLQHRGHLPRGARLEGSTAGGVLAAHEAVLRPDQPRLHGLRAVRSRVRGGAAVRRRGAHDVPGRAGHAATARRISATSSRGTRPKARSSGRNSEPFSVWSGALATAGDVVFYGTLEGYLKAVDATTGKELYRFKTPSGIIGNVNTWTHNGKQYIGVLSGIGGWAGIGMAAGLEGATDGLGAVGAYRSLANHTQLGGVLTVFALP